MPIFSLLDAPSLATVITAYRPLSPCQNTFAHTPGSVAPCLTQVGDDDCVDWSVSHYDVRFEREVVAVNGSTVTLDAPVMHPIDAADGGGYVYKYYLDTGSHTGGEVSDVAVQNIRLSASYKAAGNGCSSTTCHGSEAHARDAVRVKHGVRHAWVDGVSCYHFVFSCVHVDSTSRSVIGWCCVDWVAGWLVG